MASQNPPKRTRFRSDVVADAVHVCTEMFSKLPASERMDAVVELSTFLITSNPSWIGASVVGRAQDSPTTARRMARVDQKFGTIPLTVVCSEDPNGTPFVNVYNAEDFAACIRTQYGSDVDVDFLYSCTDAYRGEQMTVHAGTFRVGELFPTDVLANITSKWGGSPRIAFTRATQS